MTEHWTLTYRGFDPEEESLREALCTLGNGYFSTRGAAEEANADEVHYPGTYIAGGYNRLESRVANRGVMNEDLVNFPNWLPLSFRINDSEWFGEGRIEYSDFTQKLNLREGTLSRSFVIRDARDRDTRVMTQRFVSMRDPHLAAIRMSVEPVNWSGRMQFRSELDGGVTNAGVARYRDLRGDHITVEGTGSSDKDVIWLRARTKQAALEVSLCSRQRVWVEDEVLGEAGAVTEGALTVAWTSPILEVQEGQSIRIEKVISLHTSRDAALGGLVEDGLAHLRRWMDFDDLLAQHRRAWNTLWDQSDVEINVDPKHDMSPYPMQLVVRLHTFHLLQTASSNTLSLDVSVPARGWTGEAYRGHIFWDEAYILPFYILHVPEIARSLLLYRYRRLDEARAAAAAEGYAGAMFPWQSGSSGREETQIIHLNPKSGKWDPDRSRLQRHVSAAIALNVWRYVQATEDRQFLEVYGAEMLVEIARFWSSLCHWNGTTKQFEITGVMGPDEFHETCRDADEDGLSNNTYTNVMAIWCMERAQDALKLLVAPARRRLTEALSLMPAELERWREISTKMTIPVMPNGLIAHFDGYEKLDELDWDRYRAEHCDIGRMDRILKAKDDSPDRYKLSKQADLCMLFYFLDNAEIAEILHRLGYELTEERIRDTIKYYRDRTSHGSTMSHLVFGAILEEIEPQIAWKHFLKAMRSDIEDIQGGTTPEGIHTAVMAGTVRHVIERFAGVSIHSGKVRISPRLPEGINFVRCRYQAFGIPLRIRMDQDAVQVEVPEGVSKSVEIAIAGSSYEARPGSVLTAAY